MAEKAYCMDQGTGKLKVVQANDLTASDRNNEFLCCGIDTRSHKYCLAQMELVITIKGNYFRVIKSGNNHHRPCCPENDEELCIMKTISHFDRTGAGKDMRDIYSSMSADKPKKASLAAKSNGSNACTKSPGMDATSNPIIKHASVLKDPTNCKELTSLLATNNINDFYAGIQVRYLLLNCEAAGELNFSKLPDKRLGIVTLCKTSKGMDIKNKYFPYAKDILVFCDAFYFNDRRVPIFFAVRARKEIRDIFFKNRSKDIIFTVFGDWEKLISDTDNIYIADITSAKLIAVLDPLNPHDKKLIHCLMEPPEF